MSADSETADTGIWITLTERQKDLLLWQIVSDYAGGEATVPLPKDIPGREIMFTEYEGAIVIVANEKDVTDD